MIKVLSFKVQKHKFPISLHDLQSPPNASIPVCNNLIAISLVTELGNMLF